AGRVMRLVVQVRADYGRIVPVALREHSPIVYPPLFGILAGVPHSRLAACIGTMPIEKDSQSYLARVIDQLIHDLKSAETRQIRIPVEVDAAGSIAGIESLCAERQAQRVVSEALDLVEHVSPIAGPKSMRAKGVCLHAEPVNPRHPH